MREQAHVSQLGPYSHVPKMAHTAALARPAGLYVDQVAHAARTPEAAAASAVAVRVRGLCGHRGQTVADDAEHARPVLGAQGLHALRRHGGRLKPGPLRRPYKRCKCAGACCRAWRAVIGGGATRPRKLQGAILARLPVPNNTLHPRGEACDAHAARPIARSTTHRTCVSLGKRTVSPVPAGMGHSNNQGAQPKTCAGAQSPRRTQKRATTASRPVHAHQTPKHRAHKWSNAWETDRQRNPGEVEPEAHSYGSAHNARNKRRSQARAASNQNQQPRTARPKDQYMDE